VPSAGGARDAPGRPRRQARQEAGQHFRARVVVMHGTEGLTTFTLALIAATQATRH
jgi:hypothetical protein